MGRSYLVGNVARIEAQFLVDPAIPTDPSTVTCSTKSPTGTVVTRVYGSSLIARNGAGAYHLDLVLTEAGTWIYRWTGTGVCTAAIEDSIVVVPSNVL